MALSAEKQTLFDAVPVTGEIEYGELRKALINADQQRHLAQFHDMRRAGELAIRLEPDAEAGTLKMFVSRPVSG